MSQASPEAPLLTHAEFVGLKTIDELLALYAGRGVTGKREACLERAQRDWGQVALAKAKETTESPERFVPDTVARGGVEYAIYGTIHGIIGGQDREYKDFVDGAIDELDLVLFENALFYFYPKKKGANIPDFAVLGLLGSLRIGIHVGLIFFILLWEGLKELLKVGRRAGDGAEAFVYSPRYHAIDVETRRGLDDDYPILPSRLSIDYDMSRWNAAGPFAAWRDPFAIAPRSMFMAGFAEGYAISRGLERVDLVVGDLHTAEIQRFLEDPALDHPVFRSGQAWGRRSDGARKVAALVAKVLHLGLAGMAGVVVLIAIAAVVFFAYEGAQSLLG